MVSTAERTDDERHVGFFDPLICEALGYHSVQPLISARVDIGGRHHPVQERIDATKRLGAVVDDRMPLRCRTVRVFPSDYRPVLGR